MMHEKICERSSVLLNVLGSNHLSAFDLVGEDLIGHAFCGDR